MKREDKVEARSRQGRGEKKQDSERGGRKREDEIKARVKGR